MGNIFWRSQCNGGKIVALLGCEREIVRVDHALRRQREPSCNRCRNFKPFHFDNLSDDGRELGGVVSG